MIVRRVAKYRIYPDEKQRKRLLAWEGALIELWNAAVEQHQQAHVRRCRCDRKYPTAISQAAELTVAREENPWLADVPRRASMQVLVRLETAWDRCFKRLGGPPQFKRFSNGTASIEINWHTDFAIDWETEVQLKAEGRAWGGKRRDGELKFPKMEDPIRVLVHRPMPSAPKTVTIKRDIDAWYAMFLCEVEIPDPVPRTGPVVALEIGVLQPFVDSEGTIVKNPGRYERTMAKLAKAQQRLARMQKGGENWQKQRIRVAKIHRDARNQREHFVNYWSNHYTRGHANAPGVDVGVLLFGKQDTLRLTASARGTVEQPGVDVAQKAKLNGRILDVGWGKMQVRCEYKAVEVGERVVVRPVAYNSITCAKCGLVDEANRPSTLVFHCVGCGHQNNADRNAAEVRKSLVCLPGQNEIAAEADIDTRPKRTKVTTRKVRRKPKAEQAAGDAQAAAGGP